MEGLGSSLSYPLEETELAWGESRQQEWEFLPSLCSGGRPPLLAGSGVGPLPGRMTSHISHLIPQLSIFRLSFLVLFIVFLLRGHVGFISLCQTFRAGTDKQIVLPAEGGGDDGEGTKSGSHQHGEAQSPASHHTPSWHLRILWRLWRLRSR